MKSHPPFKLKNPLIAGTAILSVCGLATKVIGFFYRVFLSRILGSSGLGLYQLVMPVLSLCYALTCSGISTALSKYIAGIFRQKDGNRRSLSFLTAGCVLSVVPAVLLAILLFQISGFVASSLLKEPSAACLIRIISFSIPFLALHTCIDGYFIGLKIASVPGVTQLLEQLVRVISVYLIWTLFCQKQIPVTPSIAAFGAVFGDMSAALFGSLSLSFFSFKKKAMPSSSALLDPMRKLLSMSVPLTTNRVMLTVLGSTELVLIPFMLKKSGLTNSQALSVFGILHGMAITIILFPTTFIHSMSSMLLPEIAGFKEEHHSTSLTQAAEKSIAFSLSLGILCIGLFATYGSRFGAVIFHTPAAGSYISVLSWLCPFLYLQITCQSILHGLGETKLPLLISILGTTIEICCILFLIPIMGVKGYLFGMLACNVTESFLYIRAVLTRTKAQFHPAEWLLIPSLITITSLLGCYILEMLLERRLHMTHFITTVLGFPVFLISGFYCFLYLCFAALLFFLRKK